MESRIRLRNTRLAETLRRSALENIRSGKTRDLAELLQMAGDLHLLDKPISKEDWPDTLLEWSIREGCIRSARLLIESGSNPMRGQLGGGFVSTHLLAASAKNMTTEVMQEFVTLMSSANADFNAQDNQGWSALHWAIHKGSPDMVQILIGAGAWIDPKLLDDPKMENQIIPDDPEDPDHPYAQEALRLVRSLALSRILEGAMSSEDDPAPSSGSNRSLGPSL